MKQMKKVLSVMLALCMILTFVPVSALAEDAEPVTGQSVLLEDEQPAEGETNAEEEPAASAEPEQQPAASEPETPAGEQPAAQEEPGAEPAASEKTPVASTFALANTYAADTTDDNGSTADTYRYSIVHVDCGRKYFSPENIKAIIDNAAAAGFNQVELYLSDNQGFRFALDDMTVTTNYGSYDLTPALGDGYSDGSKYPDGSGKYLTQSEMTDIIAYARTKGIEIVPCINVPGHMGAILEEFTGFRYTSGSQTSKSSIDLSNEEAVAFALAITQKYVDYFKTQGVKYYNIGADEYANDLSSMGFEGMGSTLYTKFVEFLNSAADIIIAAGMTPRAFNDGFLYKDYNISVTPNTAYQICYWTSGWGGYDVASAETLANAGYDMINTHGDYYWVLGNTSWQCSAEKANGFDYTSFQGGTISNPAGAMFCIWCDVGNADGIDGGTAVVSATKDVIAAFGNVLQEVQRLKTVTDKDTGISVSEVGLSTVQVKEVDQFSSEEIEGATEGCVKAYDITPLNSDDTLFTSSAVVSIPVPGSWTNVRGGVLGSENGERVLGIVGNLSEENVFTFVVPHFSTVVVYDAVPASDDNEPVEVTESKIITVTVGQTTTATIEGADYSNNIVETELDKNIATVSAEYKQVTGGTEEVKAASITPGNSYYIKNSSGKYLSSDATWVNDIGSAALWTATSSSNGYILKNGDNYLRYQRSSLSTTITTTIISRIATTWSFSNGTFSYTQYSWDGSATTYILGDAYTVTTTKPVNATTVTFTGVAVGTTYVTVGNTRYTINVIAEDLSKVTPLKVEYWITNLQVTADGATSKSISAQSAYGEAGVDLSTLVPATGIYKYGSVVYWKGTVLDSSNKQTTASGAENDKTGSGKDFNLLRYYNGSWQYYYEADGTWNTISSTDQVVVYWLQPTEVTKEITTLVKDWGYSPSNQQGDNVDKVALTVAVVYPDGTVSPAEGDMYSTSTTLFNYWSGRDIGLVAPVNNSDYEIAKITVTDGTRDQSGTGQWGANDTITWKKVTNEAGEQWYDETTYWDETVGGTPMVNGVTSNITWSRYNTAKLVLIYLKPIHYDTNLIVNWVDDSAGGALISTMEVAVSSDGTPITFYNGLKQTSALPTEGVGGTFTLDDGAYVTNSSNVKQTFNKNISTVPGVADVYKTGLYQYISAVLSADGKTLTLHYNIDSSKLSKQYVVDFGLPVNVPLSALVENSDSVTKVEITGGDAIVNSDNSITYQPASMMTGTATVSVKLTFSDNTTQTVRIGFVPATTVYYEEGFAAYTGANESSGWTSTGSKGTGTQAAQVAGGSTDEYGYDAAYNSVGASNGTQATSGTVGDKATFTFTGTGVDIYANCTPRTGRLFIQVKNVANNATVKMLQVETALLDGTTNATLGQKVTGYNVPVASITGMAHGSYTVNITHMASSVTAGTATAEGNDVHLDGFRVYNTLEKEPDFYTADQEDKPTFIELRDQVLAGLSVTSKGSGQVNAALPTDTTVAVVASSAKYTQANVNDLLNNGPKNEIYLQPNQALVLKITTNREVQIGLKALDKATSYTITDKTDKDLEQTLQSSTDMFYTVLNKGTSGEQTIIITNTGSGILSVTKLKVCDDPNATLLPLTEEDIDAVVARLNGGSSGQTPSPDPEPQPVCADAKLTVSVICGGKTASAELTANGVVGETATFTAADVEKAAQSLVAKGYQLTGVSYTNMEVKYGDEATVTFTARKQQTIPAPTPGNPGRLQNALQNIWNGIQNIFNRVSARR